MGERGNIQIGGVNFYTHWGGYHTKEVVANALKRSEDRWDDEPYLASIIFKQMILDSGDCKEALESTIGHGISAGEELDMNYPTVIVRSSGFNVQVEGIDYHFRDFIERFADD